MGIGCLGYRVLGVSSDKQEDYEKILGQEFTRELVKDKQELKCHWSIIVLPNVEPPIAISIDLDFQIDEPSWAVPTSPSIFVYLAL